MGTNTTINTLNLKTDDDRLQWQAEFIIAKQAQGVSNGTIQAYQGGLRLFNLFCETRAITTISQITSDELRLLLLWLRDTGHNEGGTHLVYRVIRTFLFWWEREIEPIGWRNPIHRVQAPKLPVKTIDAVSLDDVKAMLGTCDKKTFLGIRDYAILLFLLDTGVRARECIGIDVNDLNIPKGMIHIREGKGGKERYVFIGSETRRTVRRYLQQRHDNNTALWVTTNKERMSYPCLRKVMVRRASIANIEPPRLHDFRRAFALNCLRNGMDVYSLQRLMGHSDLQTLRRYLNQNSEDIRLAHAEASPVDRLKR